MAAYSSQNVAARKKQEQEAADRRRSIGGRGSGRDRSSSNSRRDSEDERARKQQQWDKMDRSGVTSPEGLPSPQKSLRVSESPHSPEINRRNTVNAGRTPGPAPFKTQSSPVPQGRTMSPKTRGSSLSPDTRGKNAQSNSNSPTGARRRLSTGGSFKARKDTSVPRGGEGHTHPHEPRKSVSFKDQSEDKKDEADKAESSADKDDKDAGEGEQEAKQEDGDDFQPSAAGSTPPPPKQEKSYYDEDEDSKYAYSPEASPPPPSMQRRGPVVRDAARLVQQLKDGVLMTKHGRMGQPKRKILTLDENETKLSWYELEGHRSLRKSIIMMVSSRKEEDKFVALSEILEVRKGVQTEVMMAANLVDPYVSMSIVTKERTLDMTFDTHAMRDMVLRALRALLGNSENVRFF